MPWYVPLEKSIVRMLSQDYYGSLLDTMVTLFQTISGGIDWRDFLLSYALHSQAKHVAACSILDFAAINSS
eukprot:3082296-Amphidinium_carterae.2